MGRDSEEPTEVPKFADVVVDEFDLFCDGEIVGVGKLGARLCVGLCPLGEEISFRGVGEEAVLRRLTVRVV